MASERLHINAWLKDLYRNQEIPLFDHTSENYRLLTSLMQQHNNATLFIKAMINEKLAMKSDLQIKLGNEDTIQSLSYLAQSYGIGGTELSNYFTAITNASLQEMALNDELRSLDDIGYTLDKWNQDATAELNAINGILAGLQNHKKNEYHHSQNSLQRNDDLSIKTSEYVSLQRKYNSLGIERNNIRLEQIYDSQDQTRMMENQLKPKEDELKQYNGLPPDMVLASVKIQETETKLHEYLQEREHLLSDIAQSVKHSQ